MGEMSPVAVTEQVVHKYVADTLPALVKNYAVRDYDAQSWIKTAALCIVENRDLMACLQTDAGRISLRHALRFAATTGLSLNPQEGKACLVAIDGKVNYWPMKNGLVDLVMETGAVQRIRMGTVRQADKWKLIETMDGDDYEWIPARRNRGEIDLFFAAAKLTDGTSVVEQMTYEEVEEHKKRYGKGLNKPGAAWNVSFEGQGLKTVTKRLCNRLKLPPEKAKALKAAVAEQEAIEVEFTDGPAEKGASAADVEAKVKAAQAQQQGTPPAAGAQSQESAAGSPPAAAPEQTQPGASGTAAPAQASAHGTGNGKPADPAAGTGAGKPPDPGAATGGARLADKSTGKQREIF